MRRYKTISSGTHIEALITCQFTLKLSVPPSPTVFLLENPYMLCKYRFMKLKRKHPMKLQVTGNVISWYILHENLLPRIKGDYIQYLFRMQDPVRNSKITCSWLVMVLILGFHAENQLQIRNPVVPFNSF